MDTRLTLAAVAAAATLFLANDASAQARSNIQDDPRSSSCTENCIDAGYEWAEANAPTDERDCDAANEDFADGCVHWLEEQREAAAPPPEEPAEPMATDAAGPMDDGAPMDDGYPTDDLGPLDDPDAMEDEPLDPPADY